MRNGTQRPAGTNDNDQQARKAGGRWSQTAETKVGRALFDLRQLHFSDFEVTQ